MRVGIITSDQTGFYNLSESGIMNILEPLGYSFLRGTSRFSVATEMQLVEDFLSQGIDAMFFNCPADAEGSAASIALLNDAGVPVFCTDSQPIAPNIEYVTCAMSNNIAAGEMIAEFIFGQIGNEGKIAIIDGPQVTCVIERMQGYNNILAKNPNVELATYVMVSEHTTAGNAATKENILQGDPEIKAILGYCAYTGIVAETVALNMNRTDVWFGGVDGAPEEVEVIANGVAKIATAGQTPYEMGVLVAEAFIQLRDNPNANIPKAIWAPLTLVTYENAKNYKGMDYSLIRSDVGS